MLGSNQDNLLLTAIKENNLESIKTYCGNPINQKQFYAFMTLGYDENNKKNQFENMSALYIAAKNGRSDIVNFIIENAMQSKEGREKLATHLVRRDENGRNVLHTSAFTPDNTLVISALCKAASNLYNQGLDKVLSQKKFNTTINTRNDYVSLKSYVNLKDSDELGFGGTALHIAARRGQIANYKTLVQEGADPDLKSKGEKKPIDLVKDQESATAIPLMKYLLLHTNEGKQYFKKNHAQYVNQLNELSTDMLEKIVEIELDSSASSGTGKLMALNHCWDLLNSLENSKIDLKETDLVRDIVISYYGCIDYAMIETRDFEKHLSINNNNNNNNAENMENLERLIGKAKIIQSSDPEKDQAHKNAFIRASILSELNTPGSNQEALAYYGSLTNSYPELALLGMRQLKTVDQDLKKGIKESDFAFRVAYAYAKIYLDKIECHSKLKTRSAIDTFTNQDDAIAIGKIKQFLADLTGIISLKDVLHLVDSTFPTESADVRLVKLKTSIVKMLSNPKISEDDDNNNNNNPTQVKP